MKTQCQFLSEDEQLRVHERSINILEQVGIKFLSDKALKILGKNGAKVDYGEKLAKISREMVDQALKTSPKSFVLGARTLNSTSPILPSTPVMCWTAAVCSPTTTSRANDAIQP